MSDEADVDREPERSPDRAACLADDCRCVEFHALDAGGLGSQAGVCECGHVLSQHVVTDDA